MSLPTHGDEYAGAASYLHVLSVPMWTELRPRLVAALSEIEGPGPVLELGPGTGLGTEVILDALPGRAVLAAEPSPALREILLRRLSAVTGGDRVTVDPRGAAEIDLPDRLSAAVGMHMIGHLTPENRRRMLGRIARRLEPGGRVVLNVQPPDRPTTIERSTFATVTEGTSTYKGIVAAEPADDASMNWTMTYETWSGDRLVETATAGYHFWTVPVADLVADLAAVGLDAHVDGDLVTARTSRPTEETTCATA